MTNETSTNRGFPHSSTHCDLNKTPAFCFPVQPTVDGPAKSCTKRMVETCGNPIHNGINYRFQLVTTGFRWPVHSMYLRLGK